MFDSKILADVCLSTKKSETMKETNRMGPTRAREMIDSASGEEAEDAGLVDMTKADSLSGVGYLVLKSCYERHPRCKGSGFLGNGLLEDNLHRM